jgi:hypothetical protein
MVLLASSFDQSRFLRAEDVPQERLLRIKACTEEKIGQGAEQSTKLVVWFTNDKRGLVLNKTNNRTIRGAYGDDVAHWASQLIVVFPTTAPFGAKIVPCLRVRIPPPRQQEAVPSNGFQPAVAAPAAAQPQQEPPLAAAPPAASVRNRLDQFAAAAPAYDLDDEIPFS